MRGNGAEQQGKTKGKNNETINTTRIRIYYQFTRTNEFNVLSVRKSRKRVWVHKKRNGSYYAKNQKQIEK